MAQDQSFGALRGAFSPLAGPSAEASMIFKTTPCNLFGINCYSTVAGLLILLDRVDVPLSGDAIVPKKVFSVPANGMFIYDWSYPIRFGTGLVAVFSSNLNPFVFTSSATAFISGDIS